jgi:hypothetical protein
MHCQAYKDGGVYIADKRIIFLCFNHFLPGFGRQYLWLQFKKIIDDVSAITIFLPNAPKKDAFYRQYICRGNMCPLVIKRAYT